MVVIYCNYKIDTELFYQTEHFRLAGSRHSVDYSVLSNGNLKKNCARAPAYYHKDSGGLAGGLLSADKRNFHILAAVGTGGCDDHRAAHYTFGNRGDHRIDIIQPLVQGIKARLQLLQFGVIISGVFLIAVRFIRSSS
jgi:hypothetical protein